MQHFGRALKRSSRCCQHPLPPSHHTKPVLLFRPFSTVRRLDGCKCCALLLFVPVAGDAPASSGAGASARRPRLARPKMMEETMRVLTLNELMRLTRIELCGLATQITTALPTFREGSPNAQRRTSICATSARSGASRFLADAPGRPRVRCTRGPSVRREALCGSGPLKQD